jgi:hypothetical protein
MHSNHARYQNKTYSDRVVDYCSHQLNATANQILVLVCTNLVFGPGRPRAEPLPHTTKSFLLGVNLDGSQMKAQSQLYIIVFNVSMAIFSLTFKKQDIICNTKIITKTLTISLSLKGFKYIPAPPGIIL